MKGCSQCESCPDFSGLCKEELTRCHASHDATCRFFDWTVETELRELHVDRIGGGSVR